MKTKQKPNLFILSLSPSNFIFFLPPCLPALIDDEAFQGVNDRLYSSDNTELAEGWQTKIYFLLLLELEWIISVILVPNAVFVSLSNRKRERERCM